MWTGVALAAWEEARKWCHAMREVTTNRTQDGTTPAKGPQDSSLDYTRLEQTLGVKLPHWRESITRTVRQIFHAKAG